MAQIVVRKLDEAVKERLKMRARDNGRSMEEEARAILTESVAAAGGDREYGLGSEIRELFKSVGLTKKEAQGFEKRGHFSEPAKFD